MEAATKPKKKANSAALWNSSKWCKVPESPTMLVPIPAASATRNVPLMAFQSPGIPSDLKVFNKPGEKEAMAWRRSS
jgi:hypothetical protein